MIIKTINNYFNDENTYIVYDETSKDGVVIDPGCGDNLINEFVNKNNISLKYILLTHCHYDHISDVKALKKKYDIKIVSGEKCAENLPNSDINLSEPGLGYKLTENIDIALGDNESINLSGISFKCIYTPGHTSCSVCYLCDNNLFSGDTLFLRSVGRWDLPTGDQATLEKSIPERIYTLADEINVFPGHGNKTSVGYEKKFNLFIKAGS